MANTIHCRDSVIRPRHFDCGNGFSESINSMWADDSDNSVHSECVVTADADCDGTVGVGDLLAAHNYGRGKAATFTSRA